MSGTDNPNNPETMTALAECVNLIYQAGLFEDLSVRTRDWIASNPDLLKMMATSKPPALEPRLSIEEYIDHVMKIFNVPAHQREFYTVIVQVSYLMLLAEKNPLVAQQLKGTIALGEDIKYLLKVR